MIIIIVAHVLDAMFNTYTECPIYFYKVGTLLASILWMGKLRPKEG